MENLKTRNVIYFKGPLMKSLCHTERDAEVSMIPWGFGKEMYLGGCVK